MSKILSRIKRTNINSVNASASQEGIAAKAGSMPYKMTVLQSIGDSKFISSIRKKWSELSSRDQFALMFLLVFSAVLLFGYGGFTIHSAAKEKQADYQSAMNDYFWLRAQSSNIAPSTVGEESLSIENHLSQILSQSKVKNPQVLLVQDDVQMSFLQDNQAVVSNTISSIVNAGYQVTKLNMQQNPDTKVIQVQATVSNDK